MVACRIFHAGSLDSLKSEKNLLVRLRAGTSAQDFANELTARTQLLLPDHSIVAQFLVEGDLICVVGAAIGLLLGWVWLR